MKVLFQSRADLFNPRGGDTFQMEHTKSVIEKLDSSIEIDISTEVEAPDVQKYDLVHVFNIDWVCETYPQIRWAKKNKRPVVLSAIHHSFEEVEKYEKLARYDIRRLYNFLIPSQSLRDTGKNLYRSFSCPAKFLPSVKQLIRGIRNDQKKAIELADIILVQTKLEAEDIKKDFGIKTLNWRKIVNGVDVDLFLYNDKEIFNRFFASKYNVNIANLPIILNVGRIEPRKNQIALIDAFNRFRIQSKDSNYLLIFIGAMGAHSIEYSRKFLAKVSNSANVFYIGQQPQEMVASAMNHSGIYVHPSWFETTGLVCLEAALGGMEVVATGKRVKEYLGDFVLDCLPESVESISNAIIKADQLVLEYDSAPTKKMIQEEYSWVNAGRQTIEVYKNLIN